MIEPPFLFEPGERYSVRTDFPGGVNTPHEQIYRQLRQNIRRQLPQLSPHDVNDYRAMLLCGGPTLNDFVATIKRKRRQGWKVITVNGTHEWAVDHGIVPSMHVMLDARGFNVRFVARPQPTCRYLLCSQCHPSVFEALEGRDLWLWHAGAPSGTERRILDSYYRGRWLPVLGGTCVGTRALGAAVMLGIRRIDAYGWDSCIYGGRHHAYQQPENDLPDAHLATVKVGRRRFKCAAWMIKQADEFLQMAGLLPADLKLTIHGDGLIAYIVEQTAKLGRAPKMEVL